MGTQVISSLGYAGSPAPDRSPVQSDTATEVGGVLADSLLVEVARELYAQRRLRDRMFKGVVPLGEPGWDMLLDLFIAHQEGRAIRVTSACIGSGAAPTTALRLLGQLEHSGLVERQPELTDRRSTRVMLTPHAVALVVSFLASLTPGIGKISVGPAGLGEERGNDRSGSLKVHG